MTHKPGISSKAGVSGAVPRLRPERLQRAIDELDVRRDTIRDVYEARTQDRRLNKYLSPCEIPVNYLKIEAYRLIRDSRSSARKQAICKFVREAGLDPRQPSFKKNPYYWSFLYIDPDHELVTSKKKSLYAQQLLYAEMKSVPTELLIGFIYQLGRHNSLAKHISKQRRNFLSFRDAPLWHSVRHLFLQSTS